MPIYLLILQCRFKKFLEPGNAELLVRCVVSHSLLDNVGFSITNLSLIGIDRRRKLVPDRSNLLILNTELIFNHLWFQFWMKCRLFRNSAMSHSIGNSITISIDNMSTRPHAVTQSGTPLPWSDEIKLHCAVLLNKILYKTTMTPLLSSTYLPTQRHLTKEIVYCSTEKWKLQ